MYFTAKDAIKNMCILGQLTCDLDESHVKCFENQVGVKATMNMKG